MSATETMTHHDHDLPLGDLQALFLDAGNTILAMNYDLLSGWMKEAGFVLSPATLRRAEAATRPMLSRFLAGGISTESRTTLEVYVRGMLGAAGLGEAQYAGSLPGLLDVLHDRALWDQLWTCLPDGIAEALDRARARGLRLVVVSNADGTIERKLARAGLLDKLDAVVDSAIVGIEKPDPRIFEHALALCRCDAARTIHVGDLYAVDVLGARAAGIHGVLVDPFGDWQVDCPTVPSVPEMIARWF